MWGKKIMFNDKKKKKRRKKDVKRESDMENSNSLIFFN